MAENSAIEWCDHTFNPWEGCQKVGPGCDHCYAETRNARFGGGSAPNWGPSAPRRRTSPANWRKPLAWQADAARFLAEHGRRQRVFCASLADVFDNAVPREWRVDLLATIRATPNLIWLLLTKRIGNVTAMVSDCGYPSLPPNVWLGATVVNQEEADRDIPKLLAAPARVRFLSMEPLLGPVDLTRVFLGEGGIDLAADAPPEWKGVKTVRFNVDALKGAPSIGWPPLDWVIVGGESGPGARPMHPDWARSLRDQCAAAGTAFLFKQWGEWTPSLDGDRCVATDGRNMPNVEPSGSNGDGTVRIRRVGKKAAGRLLDGVQHDGVPA